VGRACLGCRECSPRAYLGATPVRFRVQKELDGQDLLDWAPLGIYVATKPDRASDGSFLQENIVASDILTDDEIARGSWLYESQLDPGGYYVMARAFDFECYLNPNCIEGFSNMLTLTIPKPAQRYGAAVQVLRYIGIGYLTLTVTPLGEKIPYRVCWTLRRGSRCLRATVKGYSWNASASDLLRVSLRGMRKVSTFTWYADGRTVASSG
jgi:hypothetical protein